MNNSERSAILKQLVLTLKKHFSVILPDMNRNAFEQLVYSICLENASFSAADEVYMALTHNYFDWNEVRVSSSRELAETMKDLPDPPQVGLRLKRILHQIFDKKYNFDLEEIRKMGMKQVNEYMEKIEYITPFNVSYLLQTVLDRHSIPVSSGEFEVLDILGLVDSKDREANAVGWLERVVEKKAAAEFFSLLHQLGVLYIKNPYGRKFQEIMLAIDPKCKSRLPKRRTDSNELVIPSSTGSAQGESGAKGKSGSKAKTGSGSESKSELQKTGASANSKTESKKSESKKAEPVADKPETKKTTGKKSISESSSKPLANRLSMARGKKSADAPTTTANAEPVSEKKPTEKKPAEKKPTVTPEISDSAEPVSGKKPTEKKATEKKPVEKKPGEKKPAAKKNAEKKAENNIPVESTKPESAKAADSDKKSDQQTGTLDSDQKVTPVVDNPSTSGAKPSAKSADKAKSTKATGTKASSKAETSKKKAGTASKTVKSAEEEEKNGAEKESKVKKKSGRQNSTETILNENAEDAIDLVVSKPVASGTRRKPR